MIRRVRLILWLFVGVAVVAAGALWLRAERIESTPPPPEAVALGAPFMLTASDGRRFDSATLAGKPYAMFFGFTHCPDVCPTTLARLAKLRRQLPKGDAALAILFISVDPERDTPPEMARYASMIGTPIVALTGTPAEIAAVTKSFGIFAQRAPQSGGGYTMDHSSATLLFDRAGKFVATIAPDEGDAPALAKLKRITS